MRVDGVAFTSPAGLEDSSNYTFRAPGSAEELGIELELPVGGGTPAAEVIAEIRDALAGFYQAGLKIEGEGQSTLAGEPAEWLHYTLSSGGRVTSRIVVANIGPGARPGSDTEPPVPGDWVKLSWADDGDPGDVGPRFDPILASFGPADSRGPAAAGTERWEIGPWGLDVPAHLVGPRNFIFEEVDAELRIELSVLEDGAAEPSLSPGAAMAGGAVELDRQPREIEGGERVDLQVREPYGETTVILAKREVTGVGADGQGSRWVVLSASAPSDEAARLNTIVDDLLTSVRAAEASA